MISMNELLMGRDKSYPNEYTKAVQQNLTVLLEKINVVRKAYNKPMTVSSGWRPSGINNTTPGAAKASKHLTGLAVDIQDTTNELWNWCMENLTLLQELGLYLEDRRYTRTWVHFQVGSPASGKRIFKPTASAPPHPELWSGTYDKQFDKI